MSSPVAEFTAAQIEHAIAMAIKERNFPMVIDLLKLLALKDPERAQIVYDVLCIATARHGRNAATATGRDD